MIFFRKASLQHAITQYMAHYHGERNHQGVGNRLLRPIATNRDINTSVRQRERLGGMLSYYYRQAA